MPLQPTGYDGFEYVSDPDAKPMTNEQLREWNKSMRGHCQRCGGRYADPSPQCPNAKQHDDESERVERMVREGITDEDIEETHNPLYYPENR